MFNAACRSGSKAAQLSIRFCNDGMASLRLQLPCAPQCRCDPMQRIVPIPTAMHAAEPVAMPLAWQAAPPVTGAPLRRGGRPRRMRSAHPPSPTQPATRRVPRSIAIAGQQPADRLRAGHASYCSRRAVANSKSAASLAACARSSCSFRYCLLPFRIRQPCGQVACDGSGMGQCIVRSTRQCRHILRCFCLDFIHFGCKSLQPCLHLLLLLADRREAFLYRSEQLPSLPPWLPPHLLLEKHRRFRLMLEVAPVATTLAVIPHGSGRTVLRSS